MNNNGINTHSAPVKQMVNLYVEQQGETKTVKDAFGRRVQQVVPSTIHMIQVEAGKIISVPKGWIIKSIADPVSYYPQRVSHRTSTQTSPLIPEKSRTMASDEAPRHNAPQTNQAKGHHQHWGPNNAYAKLLQKNGSLTSTRDFNVVANHLTSALQKKGFPANTPALATQTIQDMAHDMALHTAKDVKEFLDGVVSYEQYMAFLVPHVKNEQPTITTPVSNLGYKKKGNALNNNKHTLLAPNVMEELTKKLAQRNIEREKASAPSNEQPIITASAPSNEQPIITASVSNLGNEKTGDVLNDNKSTPAEPISLVDKLRKALQDKGVTLDTEAHSDSPGALTGSDELSAEYDDDDIGWDDDAEDWDNYEDWPGNDLKTASTPLNPYDNIGALNSSVHSESPQGDFTENSDTHLYATVDATASEDMNNATKESLLEELNNLKSSWAHYKENFADTSRTATKEENDAFDNSMNALKVMRTSFEQHFGTATGPLPKLAQDIKSEMGKVLAAAASSGHSAP